MNIATELPTARVEGVIRKAYRLNPPYRVELDDDEGAAITAEVEYVVLSANGAEVMAFSGVYRRILGFDTVAIGDHREISVIRDPVPTRMLLAQMGYPKVIDRLGRVAVMREDATPPDTGGLEYPWSPMPKAEDLWSQ